MPRYVTENMQKFHQHNGHNSKVYEPWQTTAVPGTLQKYQPEKDPLETP